MNEDLDLRINYNKVNFTYVEEQIAEYLLQKKEVVSICELSKLLNISPASITRFCKKIGLANYKELTYLQNQQQNNSKEYELNNLAMELKVEYFSVFEGIDKQFDIEKIEKTCEYIYNHRLIHIFALGLSATAAQDFKFRFSRMAKFVEVIHDRSAMEMYASILEEKDLVFLFTLRGNKYIEKVGKTLKSKGVTVITITANKESSLNIISDIAINTSSFNNNENTEIISSQIPILVQIDIIYYYYIKKYKEVINNWILTEKVLKNE